MNGKFLLVDDDDDVACVLRMVRDEDAARIPLATSVYAAFALKAAGLRPEILENYADLAEVRRLGLDILRVRLPALCGRADAIIREHLVGTWRSLSLFDDHFYYLESILNVVLVFAAALLRLVESVEPSEIGGLAPADQCDGELVWQSGKMWAARVAQCVCDARKLLYRQISWVPGDGRGSGDSPHEPVANDLSRIRTVLGRCVGECVRRIAAWRGSSPHATLLVLDNWGDIHYVIARLKKLEFRIIYWDGSGVARCLSPQWPVSAPRLHPESAPREAFSRAWGILRDDPVVRDCLRLGDCDLFPSVEPTLRHLVLEVAPHHQAHIAQVMMWLRLWGVNAVISNGITEPWRVGVGRACRALGIPIIDMQHGGAIGYSDSTRHEAHGLKWANYLLAYGSGVARHFSVRRADPWSPMQAECVVTGSPRLDVIRKQVRRPRLRLSRGGVVYAGATMVELTGPVYGSFPKASSYADFQIRLMQIFRDYPDVSVIVRLFRESPIENYIRSLGIPHVVVERTKSFADLVYGADLFLLDYAGTPLLEALTTNKRIVLLGEQSSEWMVPEARKLLERRVTICDGFDAYLSEVERSFREKDWKGMIDPDDGFLREYGNHLDDGRSLERACESISWIARNGTSPSTDAGG